MKNNKFLRVLVCIPTILLFLYFIPFIGVCLILLRLLIYNQSKISIFIIGIGIVILIPIGIDFIFTLLKFDQTLIPYLNDILESKVYTVNLINYSKLLITIGTIMLILSIIMNTIFQKIGNKLKAYIINQEKRNAEISQKNDLIIKEKQEKAKNTNVVYCPYCGADNLLTSNTGTCKYCRRKIQAKN